MRKLFFILTFLLPLSVVAQNAVSLDECWQRTKQKAVAAKKKQLNKQVTENKISNLKANYLPELNLIGQATLQSDVTRLDFQIPIPNFDLDVPTPAKDQYKAYLEIRQLIYDGGMTKNLRNIEAEDYKIKQQETENQIEMLHDKVNGLFFGHILASKKIEVLQTAKQTLVQQQKSVESAIKNGMITHDNGLLIQAELQNIALQINQTKMDKAVILESLQMLMDTTLSEKTELVFEEKSINALAENQRGETKLLDANAEKLGALAGLKNAQKLPTIAFFGQAGVGKPALNMFSDEFDVYFYMGVQLKWNLWDWKKTSREKTIIHSQQQIIRVEKENFNQAIQLQAMQVLSRIDKTQENIRILHENINLRTQVVDIYSSQFKNGTLTLAEYLREHNTLTKLQIELEISKIQLELEKVNYNTIMGY